MNIKKLIGTSMIALLVVALSIGMAVADPCDVTIAADKIINPLDGTTVTHTTVTIDKYSVAGSNPADRYVSAKTDWDDLWIRVNGTVNTVPVDTGWANNVRKGDSYTLALPVSTTSTTSTLNVWVKGNQTGDVFVEDNMGSVYNNTAQGIDHAKCTRQVVVPEFATIAIPVLALLGLVLFMRRKKD